MTRKHVDQGTFVGQFFGWSPLPSFENHFLVKLERLLDWSAILEGLQSAYGRRGRPSVPPKHMVLLLLYKHLERISDEEVVRRLATDVGMQCALNLPLDRCQYKEYITKKKRDGPVVKIKGYIDPSNLSLFRKRIGADGVSKLLGEAYKVLPAPKGKSAADRVAVDTTCVPANIPFPTDINLLEEARRWLIQLLAKYEVKGLRTYKRVARKVFLTYIRLRNQARIKTKATHRKMRGFVRRNLTQACTALADRKITKRERQTLDTIKELVRQQDELARKIPRSGKKHGIHIPNRIVSVHQGHVRPIPRGKIPQATEFGSKVLLILQRGFLRLVSITNEACADVKMLGDALAGLKCRTLSADRGFHSASLAKVALVAGVKAWHVEKKGKSRLPKTRSVKKSRSLRMALEAKIGVAKNHYGLGRIKYNRGPMSDSQWTNLCLFAMNVKSAFSHETRDRIAKITARSAS